MKAGLSTPCQELGLLKDRCYKLSCIMIFYLTKWFKHSNVSELTTGWRLLYFIIIIFWPRNSIPREEKLCYAKQKYENKLEWSLFIYLLLLLVLLYFNPRYQGFRLIWKKIDIRNCRSDHYSGQSSWTNESWSRMLLNRCNKREIHWNKKKVSCSSSERWLILCAKTVRKWEADLLIGPSISTAISWKW